MANISKIHAREIIDSRGNPTVETDIMLESGAFGRASVPSGASTGIHEAAELRDGDRKRFGGAGVLNAVQNVNTEIASKIVGEKLDQKSLDQTLIDLDGTENKGRLGANAILAVSLAFGKASADEQGKEFYEYLADISGNKEKLTLPMPLMNFLNGGKHAECAADIQECMIVPVGAKTFMEALEIGSAVFRALKKILSMRKLPTTVGDEGGFAPPLGSNEAAFKVLLEAIEKAGLKPGQNAAFAVDAASSEFYKDGKYIFVLENRSFSNEELINEYAKWIETYPIISIEDGLAEDDWEGWRKMTDSLGSKVQLVGDDFFVTNPKRLKMGIEKKAANAILVKPNQIGSVTETIETVMMAKKVGYKTIISHRSGETEDTSISHFAVGLSMGQIKTGSLTRSERLAKYNELLRIEEKLPKGSFQLSAVSF